MRKVVICFLLVLVMITANLKMAIAQTSEAVIKAPQALAVTPEIESFKAGGTSIKIPTPDAELIEVGYDVREQMEIFVPGSNRLISGYMRSVDIPRFIKGEENFILPKYASIQVARQGEYHDLKLSDFNEVVAYIKDSLGDELAKITKESEPEFNSRMKSMDLNEISFDEPVQLGTFFSKDNAYSFGILTTNSDGKMTWTMVIGTTFIRVRERLLFVYMFANHKDDTTIAMVRKITEEWADAIIAANK
ncbi:MAG: hypothetical protein KAS13_08445 [Candidatus Omnitrophica bacterium]|nr:hypothetical protein [Candidatus Omnitrophota bacterium]